LTIRSSIEVSALDYFVSLGCGAALTRSLEPDVIPVRRSDGEVEGSRAASVPGRDIAVSRSPSVSVWLFWARLEKAWFLQLRPHASGIGEHAIAIADSVVSSGAVSASSTEPRVSTSAVERAVASRAPSLIVVVVKE